MGKGSNMRSEQVSESIVGGAVASELPSSLTPWDHMKAALIKLVLDIQSYLFVF